MKQLVLVLVGVVVIGAVIKSESHDPKPVAAFNPCKYSRTIKCELARNKTLLASIVIKGDKASL